MCRSFTGVRSVTATNRVGDGSDEDPLGKETCTGGDPAGETAAAAVSHWSLAADSDDHDTIQTSVLDTFKLMGLAY